MPVRARETALLLSIALCIGCVGLDTHERRGITVHDPTYYVVASGSGSTQTIEMFVGPDLDSTYMVSGERSFLMKNEFSVKLNDGMLSEAGAKYDTTALLSLLQEGAKMAAGAAGISAPKSGVSGFQIDLGLQPGIYKLDRDGRLVAIFKKGDPNP